MKKLISFSFLIFACVIILATDIQAGSIKELAKHKLDGDSSGKIMVSALCVEGYKFVALYGLGMLDYENRGSVIPNAGLASGSSLTQIYEEKKGKVVPVRCK